MRDLGVEIITEFDPDEVECDGCLKHFVPDHDNTKHGRWGATTYVCDRCIGLGWPFGRDHKDF